jgi:hypothetical protein
MKLKQGSSKREHAVNNKAVGAPKVLVVTLLVQMVILNNISGIITT